jgi:hypothetical protein
MGKKYNWTQGVDTAAKDYLKAYCTWAYTKQAMDHWAQLIRKRLDAAHGKADGHTSKNCAVAHRDAASRSSPMESDLLRVNVRLGHLRYHLGDISGNPEP